MHAMIAAEVERRDLKDNLKLGPGGIREIEFIVQSLQLLRGGSRADLRAAPLLDVLPSLADQRMALDAAFVGGPVALAYDRFDEATRAVVHSEYIASIAAYRSENGYRIPGEFVVCRGRKRAERNPPAR